MHSIKTSRPPIPHWAPTYDMPLSTVVMPCNYSGMFDPNVAARWGMVDFDWSNGKQLWANDKPQDSERLLVTQAESVKAIKPQARVLCAIPLRAVPLCAPC